MEVAAAVKGQGVVEEVEVEVNWNNHEAVEDTAMAEKNTES